MRAAVGLSLITALLLLGARSGPTIALHEAPVSLETAALIGLCYYLSQSAWLAGLAYWTLYRPLVAGLLVGAFLGDPLTGASVGAVVQIAFLGFLGTGGALPADMALVGYGATTIALATGLGAAASLALSMPLGLLGYGLYRLRLRWSNALARRAARHARRGDVEGIMRCNVLLPQSLLVLVAWAPGVAVAYLAPGAARAALGGAPGWLYAWLDRTGGLLVALGAANGLALVWTRRTAACYLGAAGLMLAAGTPTLALTVGLVGAAGALVAPWLGQARAADAGGAAGLGQPSAAPQEATARRGSVRARDRVASFLTWLFFSHSSYSEERLQGVALAHAMVPVLNRLYTTRAELARALTRYVAPYNIEPNLGSAMVGVLTHQEEELARGQAAPSGPEEARARLAGPVSGVGDTVIHGAVGTLAGALGVALVTVVGPIGVGVYVTVMAGVVWGVSVWAYRRGYRGGFSGILDLLRVAGWRRVVVGAECAGAILFGLLTVGPVAGLLVGAAMGTVGVWEASALGRALAALPGVAIVMTFLALERWGLRQRWATVACYGIGLGMALVEASLRVG